VEIYVELCSVLSRFTSKDLYFLSFHTHILQQLLNKYENKMRNTLRITYFSLPKRKSGDEYLDATLPSQYLCRLILLEHDVLSSDKYRRR